MVYLTHLFTHPRIYGYTPTPLTNSDGEPELLPLVNLAQRGYNTV